ncbi:SLAP domain-containing protein [Lactobacillus melliventris]|uniref:SLAP domain protein n=1 Tax=Lactobacillus melliventris TaxID=1218507 RepID=A0A0F4LDY4_9LACO|nr:SLAP domain-containing protein [Lactobacillus melliventris]KJY55771.1 SLAP domain protein [Lactobacillus melliventris]
MSKNSFYRKMIVSVAGATLLAVGVNQLPVNALGSTPTEVSAAKKANKTKKVGANSAVYKQKGKKLVKTKVTVKVGQKVSVLGKKTVKGKVYYKIGKNQYIKAVNVDGKTVQVVKNTVLVTRSGKALKKSKVRKGQKVTVYGGTVKIKGKKYYSTSAGYIKVSALAKDKTEVTPISSTGSTGSNGSTGSTSSNGSTGSTSSNGSTGSTSSNGSTGSTSSNGSTGSTSSNGSTGSTGSNGSTGSTSSNGSTSSTGSNGSTNSTGSSSSSAANPSK